MTETIDKGRSSFDTLRPQLQALENDELATITINVESAAMGALSVATSLLSDEELLDRYRSLPATEFDMAQLDTLDTLAWATIHANAAAASARSRLTKAALPTALVAQAGELRQRMQRCCEYYLADHPVAGSIVEGLRRGSGYRDLAHDLLGYAALYRDHHDIVSEDTKNYHESDIEDAVRIGERMVELLGGGWSSEDQQIVDDYVRAWTLLSRAYNEIRSTGLWLMRHQPTRARESLPSLTSLGRRGSGRSTSEAEGLDDGLGEGQVDGHVDGQVDG